MVRINKKFSIFGPLNLQRTLFLLVWTFILVVSAQVDYNPNYRYNYDDNRDPNRPSGNNPGNNYDYNRNINNYNTNDGRDDYNRNINDYNRNTHDYGRNQNGNNDYGQNQHNFNRNQDDYNRNNYNQYDYNQNPLTPVIANHPAATEVPVQVENRENTNIDVTPNPVQSEINPDQNYDNLHAGGRSESVSETSNSNSDFMEHRELDQDKDISRGVTEHAGGTIVNDRIVFERSKSPYLLKNDLIVEEKAEVIIEPGVEVRVVPQIGVTVRGVLTAVVSSTKSIFIESFNCTIVMNK